MRRILLLLVPLLLITTACGFHLRGSRPQAEVDAVTSVQIVSKRAADVSKEVTGQLQQADIEIVEEEGTAEYLLTLANERVERNVLSVSAETGKAEEYQLLLTVYMSLERPGEETLLQDELIEVSRDYTFDEDAVLGKFSEEQVLREEMIQRAASQIILRLNAAARND